MIRKHYKAFLAFVAIAFSLNAVFFSKLKEDQFLFIGDQFFRFSSFETFINSFFIRILKYLGANNGWQFMTQFWDALYYLFVYKLGVSFFLAEKMLFFIVLLISLWFSFVGFQKIKSLFHIAGSEISVFVITLWYSFNPYAVMLWHGGVYNLGSALTYSLAPLLFYYFHTSIFLRSNLKTKIICALLFFLASFTFWLFAGLIFFFIVYSLLYLLLNRKVIGIFLKNSLILLSIYLPLVAFLLFTILYVYYNTVGDNNAMLYTSTFGNEQGGLWYQFLLLFSWGIYNVWTPRSMYSFHAYYFSPQYIVATLSVYFVLFFGAVRSYAFTLSEAPNLLDESEDVHPPLALLNYKRLGLQEMWWRSISILRSALRSFVKFIFQKRIFNAKSKEVTILFIILALSLFFAKAAQPPFGNIFLFFYEHVPFFKVFRTADIRFGFLVVLAIAILLLYISNRYKKYFFFVVILTILIFQNPFFFSGIAIYGENKDQAFYDRIISIPKDYQEVIDFFNNDDGASGYILPIPSISYGHYILESRENYQEHHIGQDVLSKFIKRPFVHLSESGEMYTKTYLALDSAIKGREYIPLREFPIKYILVRRDIPCAACVKPSDDEVKGVFKKIFKNETFSIFAVDNYTPIIDSKNIYFKIINPVKYRIQFSNVRDMQELNFMLSFNKHWKLYINKIKNRFDCDGGKTYEYSTGRECVADNKYFEGEELSYLRKKSLFADTHNELHAYANSWEIDPEFIKNNFDERFYSKDKDGSINFELVVYYQPQSWFYLTFILSAVSFFALCIYLLASRLSTRWH